MNLAGNFRMYDRYAIDAQAGDRLGWIRHFIGLSYTPNGDLLDVVKQWAPIESIRPMLDNTVVTVGSEKIRIIQNIGLFFSSTPKSRRASA